VIKRLLIVLWLLLANASAQVTYSNTPTQEELEQYFVGGLQILEIPVAANEELRYQLVNLKDMQTLWAGATGNLEPGESEGATIRMSLAVIDFFADNCPDLDEANGPDVNYQIIFHQLRFLSRETGKVMERSKGGQCISFGSDYNLGHWTNILAAIDGPLPKEGWLPATAFIPNFYDGRLEYGSAETWLVLLVTFDDLNYGANPNELSQEEVINLLQDYGLDTTP
jgi:hypothetical protein